MSNQKSDPRDIERVNPDTNANADTNSNAGLGVLGEPEQEGESVAGAVVRKEKETDEKAVFPGKGQGENKKAGGKHAA